MGSYFSKQEERRPRKITGINIETQTPRVVAKTVKSVATQTSQSKLQESVHIIEENSTYHNGHNLFPAFL